MKGVGVMVGVFVILGVGVLVAVGVAVAVAVAAGDWTVVAVAAGAPGVAGVAVPVPQDAAKNASNPTLTSRKIDLLICICDSIPEKELGKLDASAGLRLALASNLPTPLVTYFRG
jgi:hypothetical protein